MEKNEKYLQAKREYNSRLSTFQISKELHKKVKDYCSKNNIKVKEFLEQIIKKEVG